MLTQTNKIASKSLILLLCHIGAENRKAGELPNLNFETSKV